MPVGCHTIVSNGSLKFEPVLHGDTLDFNQANLLASHMITDHVREIEFLGDAFRNELAIFFGILRCQRALNRC